MKTPDLIAAINLLTKVFKELGIAYYIGGSVASSAYGIARATMDVDLVADIKKEQISSLVKKLEAEYYISENMVREAIINHSSFNIIHLETMMKVDIFILKKSPYQKLSFQRRKRDLLTEEEYSVEIFFASPEDVILNKLDWYRLSGQGSERQWQDVIGVIKVQEHALDIEYLKKWASVLDLHELVAKAFNDAGVEYPGHERDC